MNFLNKAGLERLWMHIILKLNRKVDKIDGKNLSTNDFTNEDKEKLNSIKQSDWAQTDETQLDFIKNKPDVATKDYVDSEISSLSEEMGNSVPETDQPNMQLVTDENGQMVWEEKTSGANFPNGTEWQATSVTTSSWPYNGLVVGYGAVICDTGDGFYRSTDGKQWTPLVCDDGDIVQCIHYAGAFYFVSENGSLYRSYDMGETWAKLTSPVSVQRIVGVAGKLFISDAIAGGTGSVYVSNDGVTWTETSFVAQGDEDIDAIQAYRGVYMITEYGSKRTKPMYSEDGVTWNTISVIEIPVNGGGGIWVGDFGVCFRSSQKGVYYSEDGMNWSLTFTTDKYINSLRHVAGVWFVGVRNDGTYYSRDGKTWTKITGVDGVLGKICYGGGAYVACGADDPGMYFSKDGASWTKTSSVAFDTWDYHGPVYINGLFHMFDETPQHYYSEDGITWISAKDSGSITVVDVEAFKNGLIAASGKNGLFFSETWACNLC